MHGNTPQGGASNASTSTSTPQGQGYPSSKISAVPRPSQGAPLSSRGAKELARAEQVQTDQAMLAKGQEDRVLKMIDTRQQVAQQRVLSR